MMNIKNARSTKYWHSGYAAVDLQDLLQQLQGIKEYQALYLACDTLIENGGVKWLLI